MKKIGVLFIALFIAAIPVVLLLTDVQLVAYDRGYYRDEYIKYNIPNAVGMSMDNLMNSTEELLLYLENKREDLDFKGSFEDGEKEFFSQRDKHHMIDVKELFVKGFYIRNLSFVYILVMLFLILRKRPIPNQVRSLAWYGIAAAAAGVLPVLLVVVLMSIDFYKYFTIFHEIFFTNDLWLLDPAVDRLVNIFPQDFFTDMAFRISWMYIAEMFALLICSILILKLVKERHN